MKMSWKWLYDIKSFAYVLISIASLVAFLGGIYILSPIFANIAEGYNDTSPLLSGLVSFGAIPLVGGLLVGIPAMIFAGMRFKKKALVRYGSFALAIIYVFLAALRIFAVGIFPLSWLNILALGIIVALCRLVIE